MSTGEERSALEARQTVNTPSAARPLGNLTYRNDTSVSDIIVRPISTAVAAAVTEGYREETGFTVVSRMVTFPDGFLSRKDVSRVVIFPDETISYD